jgi:coenzyme PQQ precursor peptide PqqA
MRSVSAGRLAVGPAPLTITLLFICAAGETSLNVIFLRIKTEAIDRSSLSLPADPQPASLFLHRSTEPGQIIRWRTFRTALPYTRGRKIVPLEKETAMSWKTPKIVEVPVGMEINMYACAARK